MNNHVHYVDPDGNGPWALNFFVAWYWWLKNNVNMIGEHPTKGNDRYAHCMANCYSASVGEADSALLLSGLKEIADIGGHYCGLPSKRDQPPSSSSNDFKANLRGLMNPFNCEAACGGYRE